MGIEEQHRRDPIDRAAPVERPLDGVRSTPGLRERSAAVEFESTSLRELYRNDTVRADQVLDDYYRALERAFPDPDERESKELYRKYLTTEGDTLDFIVFRAPNGQVLGGIHYQQLATPDGVSFCIDEHVWVEEQTRRSGLGSQFIAELESMMRERGVEYLVAEINDPALMTPAEAAQDAESGITANQRTRFWERLGYRQVNAPYIQPPIDEGLGTVDYLMWIVKPLDGSELKTLPNAVYEGMLRGFYGSFLSDVNSDPSFQSIMAALAGITEIELIRPTDTRTRTQNRGAEE